eukprot:6532571-Alexandrium_andersonii.AAC.1
MPGDRATRVPGLKEQDVRAPEPARSLDRAADGERQHHEAAGRSPDAKAVPKPGSEPAGSPAPAPAD